MSQVNQIARQTLGPFGIWLGGPEHFSDTATAQRDALRRLDALTSYGSIWTGEGVGGRDIYAQLGIWLAATQRLAAGAGIANVWARAPEAAEAAGATLAEAYPGRFINGIGIGHPIQADQVGADYSTPLATMRQYLQRMHQEAQHNPLAVPPFPTVIAAVGPKMLDVAAESADGAHPYFVPVAHTAEARQRLGPYPLLIPEQSVLVDPTEETLAAYRHRLSIGTQISHYRAGLKRFGLSDDDLDHQTDKFFDAVAVAGTPELVAQRIIDHLVAGADHVLVSAFGNLASVTDQLQRLAPALGEAYAHRTGAKVAT
ncbi:MAG TPA: TIGR03620 family F420-dependent LLM class oxidoreductase [Mycobacterium sp.]|nr:TIGR03620 family F420-dependent LLM class oxidoreductase [Mycobacterium sp.]